MLVEGLSLPDRSGARRHGPYWQLSRSSGGTTRTRRLSEAEARLYQEWIANRRRAEALLDELEDLAVQAADLVLAGGTDGAPGKPERVASGEGDAGHGDDFRGK